jgi:predicted transcriptional regulator
MQTSIFKKHNYNFDDYLQIMLVTQQNTTIYQICSELDIDYTKIARKVQTLVKSGFIDRLTIGSACNPAVYRISKAGRLMLQDIKDNIL